MQGAVHISADKDVCYRLVVVIEPLAESAVKASGFDKCQAPHMTQIRELFTLTSRGQTGAAPSLGPETSNCHYTHRTWHQSMNGVPRYQNGLCDG